MPADEGGEDPLRLPLEITPKIRDFWGPRKRGERVLLAEVGDEQLQGFGAEILVPKGFGYPIAYGGFALAGREVAVARGTVAYGTDEQVVFLADDCPCGGVAEDGLDDVQALLHRLVGCPTRPRSHIGVGGVSVQEWRIVVFPRTEKEPI